MRVISQHNGHGVATRKHVVSRTTLGRRRVLSVSAAVASPTTSGKTMNAITTKEQEQLQMEMGFCRINQPYSPDLLQQQVFSDASSILSTVSRSIYMFSNIVGFAFNLYMDRGNDTPSLVKRRATELRDMLTKLGPTFIKAGQVLANRPDILREDYMNELIVLQDDVPPFSDEEAFKILELQLGRPLGEVFSSISEQPVAAASLGQVYKGVLRDTGEAVAVKIQRPGVEPIIYRDLFIFRAIAKMLNPFALARLGCNAELIVDEFGEKLLEELDYVQEARNLEDFRSNFMNDDYVKIPWVRRDLSGPKVLVMEWIDGIRCTDVAQLKSSGINLDEFIRVGVVSGLRQLLEFGLFHGDPHPGNIFAMRDGRIAYVDFGNVAELSQTNKEVLIDAVVHAVNKDYQAMAQDFIKLGFLAPGTDVRPIVPALEKIWADSMGRSLADFNFRTVTSKFNELVYEYPIRIPERYSLVIRSLLTQEGICLTLKADFHFLEVAYPYVARRLLTDEDPALRQRLFQVLFQDGKFRWDRLENLLTLANQSSGSVDLSSTVADGARLVLLDEELRQQLLIAFTEDDRLHFEELQRILNLLPSNRGSDILRSSARNFPKIARDLAIQWSDRILEN
ncbi:hypothetical protein M9434_000848 [Picochlorum sp. BPE23]|nr:hypothetical protein M9434_000848 [Picochlorum sp. BPE23]